MRLTPQQKHFLWCLERDRAYRPDASRAYHEITGERFAGTTVASLLKAGLVIDLGREGVVLKGGVLDPNRGMVHWVLDRDDAKQPVTIFKTEQAAVDYLVKLPASHRALTGSNKPKE